MLDCICVYHAYNMYIYIYTHTWDQTKVSNSIEAISDTRAILVGGFNPSEQL